MQHLNSNRSERIQRWLLRVLRHSQSTDGLSLDRAGWADVPDVLAVLPVTVNGWTPVSQEELLGLIATCLSDRVEWHGQRIRARYGHSLAGIEVGRPAIPPETLFHGTDGNSLAAILQSGLLPMGRQHVQLTSDRSYATQVAAARQCGLVLAITTRTAADRGTQFLATTTHVWLADRIGSESLVVLNAVVSAEGVDTVAPESKPDRQRQSENCRKPVPLAQGRHE